MGEWLWANCSMQPGPCWGLRLNLRLPGREAADSFSDARRYRPAARSGERALNDVGADFRGLFVQLHEVSHDRELWMHRFLGGGTCSMLRNCVDVLLVFALKVRDLGGWPCCGNCMSSRTCWVLCFVLHATCFPVFNVRRVGGASVPSVDFGVLGYFHRILAAVCSQSLGGGICATRTPDRLPVRSYPIGC